MLGLVVSMFTIYSNSDYLFTYIGCPIALVLGFTVSRVFFSHD
jgi:hypothetical protein